MNKEKRYCKCGKEIPPPRNTTIWAKKCPSCTYAELYSKNKQNTHRDKNNTLRREKRTKSKNFSIYTTTAWKYFSHYVLVFYADRSGYVQCSTSPSLIYHVTDRRIHVGHFIKVLEGTKTQYSVAFEFCNVAPQSHRDNVYFGGKPEVMEKWLIKKHGQKAIDELNIKKHNICHLDKLTLDLIKDEYKEKYKQLLINKKIEDPWKPRK